MDNVKDSVDARADSQNSMGDIADWLNSVTKQDSGRNVAFRKTLDLLDG